LTRKQIFTMRLFNIPVLSAFLVVFLAGCCKYVVKEKELHIHFSKYYAPTDTVTISFCQRYTNKWSSENMVIGDERVIILNEYTHSSFGHVDTIIIEIKSKHIADTLTNFTYTTREEDVAGLGCSSKGVKLFSFEKDNIQYTEANIIQIGY